jgi:integrase
MDKNKSQFSTDKAIKEAKPKEKDYALTDSKTTGLQIRIRTNGKKQWVYRYSSPTILTEVKDAGTLKQKGKRSNIGLGMYPETSLAKAREKAGDFRKLIIEGIDPSEHKKIQKDELIKAQKNHHAQIHNIFYEWINTLSSTQGTVKRKISLFENNLFPYLDTKRDKEGKIISSKNIKDITHPEILKAVNEKKKSANEMARRLLGDCKTLWNFAIAYGYTERNIIDLIPTSEKPKKIIKHYPKITDEHILGNLLKDMQTYSGHPITKAALQLTPYVMLRAENLVQLKWEYIDFEKKLITIPRILMKVKDINLDAFKLPLTPKAIEILEEVHHYTKDTEWVFHAINRRSSPLNSATINKAIRVNLGYDSEENGTKQTIHSFRGTFSSLAYQYRHEHKQYEVSIERVLDHQEKNETVASYNHKADYTNSMRELLEWWEQFLQRCMNG